VVPGVNALTPVCGCPTGTTSLEDALVRVLALVADKTAAEAVPPGECVGRVLAEVFMARLDLPGFDQSAMDGYAVSAADLMPGAVLPLTGRTAAGEAPGRLAPGGAHRILTGAPLPGGADAVIAQEHVRREGDWIHLAAVPPPGTNVRRRGEDMRSGNELIAAGTVLDWRHVTVLAAQGAATVRVRCRPRVALLSSGRELRNPGHCLAPGQIHDSNLPMLAALLHGFGASVRPLPVVDDDPAALRAALCMAAEEADLVLTTAGISVGDEDHIRAALHALGGDLTVLKVAMKPGKPLAAGRFGTAGRLGTAVFIGLPGNPQAALAGAFGFVRPLLARMTGTEVPPRLRAFSGFDLKRRGERAEFIPVRLRRSDTRLWAERAGPDGSGRLAPLLGAHGFAFLPTGSGDVRHGGMIEVIAFGACTAAVDLHQ
jgi:molybdopterin molybdotransferase